MGTKKQCLMCDFDELCDDTQICLAILMPNGDTELIINQDARAKLEYIDKAYDDDLCLKANRAIEIISWMFY